MDAQLFPALAWIHAILIGKVLDIILVIWNFQTKKFKKLNKTEFLIKNMLSYAVLKELSKRNPCHELTQRLFILFIY